ncbi:unnamed protein product [Closterium sp. NIES-65]|nr:unnamed protein product [Closterium sp. NIES-65]
MQSFNLSDSDMDADEADGRVEDEGQNQPGELAMTEKKEIWDASVGSMVEVLNDDVSRLCWRPAEVVFSRLLEVKVRYFTPRSISGEDKEVLEISSPDTLNQNGVSSTLGFLKYLREIVWEALQREESCDSEQEKLIPKSTSRVGDVITKQMWEEYSSCTPEGSLSSDLATHHKTPTEATVRNLCQESQPAVVTKLAADRIVYYSRKSSS